MLKVGDEYEDYLFYRGIGNFNFSATFSVDQDETLQIQNHSIEAIPFAFKNIRGKFRYKTIILTARVKTVFLNIIIIISGTNGVFYSHLLI